LTHCEYISQSTLQKSHSLLNKLTGNQKIVIINKFVFEVSISNGSIPTQNNFNSFYILYLYLGIGLFNADRFIKVLNFFKNIL